MSHYESQWGMGGWWVGGVGNAYFFSSYDFFFPFFFVHTYKHIINHKSAKAFMHLQLMVLS